MAKTFPHIEKFKELAKLSRKEAYEHYQEIVGNTNYDENQVPDYTIPSPLDIIPGKRIATAAEWIREGRPAVFRMFQNEMYGRIPPRPDKMEFTLISFRDDALEGKAIRKEVRITLSMANGRRHSFDLLMYAPKTALEKPVPAFLGLNFKGNQATTDEMDVRMTGWKAQNPALMQEDNRGSQTHRWHFKQLVEHGYAGATVCYHDIFPDRATGWGESVLALFEDLDGFEGPHPHYSSIGAWAYGLSRAMDYLESDPLIDASRVAMHGHSRLGKTALWAGACDRRFRIVISNCSGCGGAALSRRWYGETYTYIANVMPHWFVEPFRKYIGNEDTMPFDQNELIALSAPRAVAVASATEDQWADPKGEFIAAKAAEEVYALFGSKGLPASEHPAPDIYVTGDISYHLRTGKHDQTPFDWEHYIQLADIYLR